MLNVCDSFYSLIVLSLLLAADAPKALFAAKNDPMKTETRNIENTLPAAACPECHPPLFDAAREVTPVPLFCSGHERSVIASFFCPPAQGNTDGGLGQTSLSAPAPGLTPREHNAAPGGRWK